MEKVYEVYNYALGASQMMTQEQINKLTVAEVKSGNLEVIEEHIMEVSNG